MSAFLTTVFGDPIVWPAVDPLLKGAILLAAAAVAVRLLRRSTAATRHLVWTAALAGSLALPAVTYIVPDLAIPVATVREPSTDRKLSDDEAVSGTTRARAAGASTATHAWRDDGSISRVRTTPSGKPRTVTTSELVASFVTVWAAGCIAILGYLLLGAAAARRIVRTARPAATAPWVPLALRLAEDLKIRRVAFLRSDEAAMPMTIGILNPVVIMPAAADGWSEDRLEVILLHELAHVSRADCLTHLLSQLACAAYWINPLVWTAARRARIERERACDDVVLAQGTPRGAYAAELIEIARALGGRLSPAVTTTALAMAERSQLEGRVMAILDPSVPRSGVTRRRAFLAAVLAFVLLAPLAAVQPWVGAESPQPPFDEPVERPREAAVRVEDRQQRDAPIERRREREREIRAEREIPIQATAIAESTAELVASVLEDLPSIINAAVEGAVGATAGLQRSGLIDEDEIARSIREALQEVRRELSDTDIKVRVRERMRSKEEALRLKERMQDIREGVRADVERRVDRERLEEMAERLGREIQREIERSGLRDEIAETMKDVAEEIRRQVRLAVRALDEHRRNER